MQDPTTTPVDMLQDLENDYQYEEASTGIRFANYIIDLISFYILFIGAFTAFILITNDEAIITWIDELPVLVDRLLGLLMYGIYMSLVEGFSKGRSLGKLITGTRAIRWDNQPFSWSDALGRGFSRVVPFEPFSALWGNPWHDKWTDTRVVKNRR